MRSLVKSTVANGTILALILMVTTLPGLAGTPGGRLDGILLDLDGKIGAGYAVHLIDGDGNEVSETTTDAEGAYTFSDLAPGSYSLAIENAEGGMALVAGPPVKIRANELARRDLKLVEADQQYLDQMLKANRGGGQWWSGLSPAAKGWFIGGLSLVAVTTTAIIVNNNDDDDDYSQP